MSPGIESLYMGQHLQLCLCLWLCYGYGYGLCPMAMAVILLPFGFAGFDFCVSTKSIIPQLLIIITQHIIMS